MVFFFTLLFFSCSCWISSSLFFYISKLINVSIAFVLLMFISAFSLLCLAELCSGWCTVYVESITWAKNFSFFGCDPLTWALAFVILAPFFIRLCVAGCLAWSERDGLSSGLFLEDLFSLCLGEKVYSFITFGVYVVVLGRDVEAFYMSVFFFLPCFLCGCSVCS